MRAEFAVDEVIQNAEGVLVRGGLNYGTVRVGDIFTTVCAVKMHPGSKPGKYVAERTNLRNVQLKIRSIITYRCNIDELVSPCSGELELEGLGVDTLKADDRLELDAYGF